MLTLSLFYPHFFHNYDIDVKPTYSLKFSELSTKQTPQFPSKFSCYLIESTPTFFSLLTKSIPLFSLKLPTLFNKNHRTFFSQVFQVINKKYLTFLKCLSHYSIKSNPIFFIANNKYPTIFLQVFHSI
jgi:hypothetical protein